MRGEDWITPGGSQRKTGEANLTLTYIMNQVEVPVSQFRGCRDSKEHGKKAGERGVEQQQWIGNILLARCQVAEGNKLQNRVLA